MTGKRNRTTEQRFWDMVDKRSGDNCWEWKGAKNNFGYGRFRSQSSPEKRTVFAHRWIVEQIHGPIPSKMQVDHLCRNPSCVRPDHLEIVTNRENVLRSMLPEAITHRTGICQRGHDMTIEGNSKRGTDGRKACAVCIKLRKGQNRERSNEQHRQWRALYGERENEQRRQRCALKRASAQTVPSNP